MQDPSNQDILVILEEEYGYKHWFWYPGMNDSELVKWWESLESVDPYFMTPEPLPGKLIEVDDLDEWIKKDKSKNTFMLIHIVMMTVF